MTALAVNLVRKIFFALEAHIGGHITKRFRKGKKSQQNKRGY